MAVYKFNIPYRVHLPRKTKPDKVVRLNHNEFNTLHYRTKGEAKKILTAIMSPELEGLKLSLIHI